MKLLSSAFMLSRLLSFPALPVFLCLCDAITTACGKPFSRSETRLSSLGVGCHPRVTEPAALTNHTASAGAPWASHASQPATFPTPADPTNCSAPTGRAGGHRPGTPAPRVSGRPPGLTALAAGEAAAPREAWRAGRAIGGGQYSLTRNDGAHNCPPRRARSRPPAPLPPADD